MNLKKSATIFCAIALALAASCAPQVASLENAKLKLSRTSSVADYSRAISNVERGYSGIGKMSLEEIEAIADLDQEARRQAIWSRRVNCLQAKKHPLRAAFR